MPKVIDLRDPDIEVRKSMCYFCHTNCGVLAYVRDGEVVYIEGDPDHPTNAGGLCCRGNIALKHLDHPDRINKPLKRTGEKGANQWEEITWGQALDEIAERLAAIKDEYGAEAVATAGGTVRTDDWARRRFMNLFGSPNSFHNALLCWIPTFMIETAISGWSPFLSDMENSRVAVIWGANPGASTLPAMRGLTDLHEKGLKLICIDPRFTETAAHADLWLPIRPGADLALALAWINVIIDEELYDAGFVEDWCYGFKELVEHVEQFTPEWAAPLTWLDPELIRESARMYATNTPGNIQWGTSLDQQGKPSGAAIHARAILRAITGNIDCPGGDLMPGPSMEYTVDEELEANEYLPEEQRAKQLGSEAFKLCSWPGYRLISDIAREYWGKAPTAEWMCEANAPAVFRAILTEDPYPIRALLVAATNPVNSYGNSREVLEALKKVDFLVTNEYWMTSAALYSDYVLPIAGALERPVVHNNYGCAASIVTGERAVYPLHERGTDYWFWQGLGLRLGQGEELWPWANEEEAYFDIVEPLGFEVDDYNGFVREVGFYFPKPEYYRYKEEGFFTRTGRVELYSTVLEELGYPPLPQYCGPVENEVEHPELAEEYPLALSTAGGFMPFHHSEEFNIKELRYLRHDPYMEINPATAARLGIEDGDWCWVETLRGRIRQRANVTNAVHEKVVLVQRGWWYPERKEICGDDPFGVLESNANVLTATAEEHCDPISGTWANRGLLCRVYKAEEGGLS
ncbi:MAG: molybdopterin-dependent oxidoreductase [Coriobacteriia bacterium]|nr:molybdopterin-dependent oxidoreductase [Coriobacteriia bacterium]